MRYVINYMVSIKLENFIVAELCPVTDIFVRTLISLFADIICRLDRLEKDIDGVQSIRV